MSDTVTPPPTATSYISDFLDRYNLTSAAFAEAIGLSGKTLSRILQNRILISIRVAHDIENAYPELNALMLLTTQGRYELWRLDHPAYQPDASGNGQRLRRRLDIDDDEIVADYCDREMSMKKIAAKHDCSTTVVDDVLNARHVPRRPRGRRPKRTDHASPLKVPTANGQNQREPTEVEALAATPDQAAATDAGQPLAAVPDREVGNYPMSAQELSTQDPG